MEIKAQIEEKVVKGNFVTVTLTPENAQRIVEVLNSIVKKSKPDRYEEFILRDLIQALEAPEKIAVEDKRIIREVHEHPLPDEVSIETQSGVVILHPDPVPIIDKVHVINIVKQRVDPQNKEHINDFIKGSIKFAKDNMGIATVPKSNSLESFYDWLVGEGIINADGSPGTRR